jgi:hypothetical protein
MLRRSTQIFSTSHHHKQHSFADSQKAASTAAQAQNSTVRLTKFTKWKTQSGSGTRIPPTQSFGISKGWQTGEFDFTLASL